jgi:hypothetical protein
MRSVVRGEVLKARFRELIRPMTLGLLACALAFGALEGVRKCDVTPPCPRGGIDAASGLQIACRMVMILGPCPIVSLNGLGSAVVGWTVGAWAYLRRRDAERRV